MGFLSKLKEKRKDNEKYASMMEKSRSGFSAFFKNFGKNKYVDEDYFDELEQVLITSDIGVDLSLSLVSNLKEKASKDKIVDASLLNDLVVEELVNFYTKGNDNDYILNLSDGLNAIMVVGVNGVGKTTSIAKLANKFKVEGKKVLLAAADTFRAGAVDQLEIWANKVGVDIVIGNGKDPSSVIYDAAYKASKEKYDILLCDTAGRIQTKQALMDELAKMNRTLEKVINKKADETLLVLDATTGQNGVIQASSFFETVNVSGIILTKMDSTSKGGIILSIKDKLDIPVKYICFGEKLEDIANFDINSFIYELTSGMEE